MNYNKKYEREAVCLSEKCRYLSKKVHWISEGTVINFVACHGHFFFEKINSLFHQYWCARFYLHPSCVRNLRMTSEVSIEKKAVMGCDVEKKKYYHLSEREKYFIPRSRCCIECGECDPAPI